MSSESTEERMQPGPTPDARAQAAALWADYEDAWSAIERNPYGTRKAEEELLRPLLLRALAIGDMAKGMSDDMDGRFLKRYPKRGLGAASGGNASEAPGYVTPTSERLTVSWDEFMAETYPPVPSLWGAAFLVKGGGYRILSGDTGVGKTVLESNLILSLAEGRDEFLGFPMPGRPISTLFLEAEGSRQLFRDRLAQIARNRGISISPPIRFHPRGSDLTIERLGNMVADSKAEHVFLDPVGRFHGGNENDTTDWRRYVTNPLATVATDLTVAQSICDHYSKPNENRSGQHKVRGSAAKIQDCGAAMRLEYGRGGGSSRVLLFDRVRDGALPFPDRDPSRMPLTIDLATGTIAVDEREDANLGTTAEPRLDDVATLVKKLEASSDLGKVSTTSLRQAIESNLDLSKSRATDLISAARIAGKIVSAGRGYYRSPSNQVQTLLGDPS